MPFDVRSNSTWVSADALSGCSEVAKEAGFDIQPYLFRHGIDPDLVENSRGLVLYAALGDCLEDIARTEGCADFGFRLAQKQKPLQFGIISQVLQFAATVGEAIELFLRYRDLYSQSSHWELVVEEEYAQLKRQDFGLANRRSTQIVALSVTRGFAAIRSLMGDKWSPIAVYLSTDEVAFSANLRRFFGAPVLFNSPYDGIAFDTSDLKKVIPTGNAEILTALTSHFDRLFPKLNGKGPVSSQVQKQVRLSFEHGGTTLDAVARHFGMHPRSLQRALSAEGSSFRQLEQEVRLSIAHNLVEGSRTSLSEVATSAGYRHLSSLSRAYKRSKGSSPSRSRNDQKDPARE